jgi:hypothetical protein
MHASLFHTLIRCIALVALGACAAVINIAAYAEDCAVVADGLRAPIGNVWTEQENVLVSETGIVNVPNSGRISIVVLPIRTGTDVDHLVLENNFAPVPAFPPTDAAIRRFETPSSDATVVNECTLNRPTSMSLMSNPARSTGLSCYEERSSRRRSNGCSSNCGQRVSKLAIREHPETLDADRIMRSWNPAWLDDALDAHEALGFEIAQDDVDRRTTEPTAGSGEDIEPVQAARLVVEDF